MTEQSFALIPFPDSHTPAIMITGGITREQGLLKVQYLLTGTTEDILFPTPVSSAGRKGELWLATCFEFFLALPDQPQYWEFNLSPSGEWNAFRMDAYRRIGFREEEQVRDLRLDIRRERDRFRLDAAVDLNGVLDTDDQIQAGITAVIQGLDGNETYWALAHPGIQADFHLRESFILAL
jgi:hypothetical protein